MQLRAHRRSSISAIMGNDDTTDLRIFLKKIISNNCETILVLLDWATAPQ